MSEIKNRLNDILFYIPLGLVIVVNLLMLSFYRQYIEGIIFDFSWTIFKAALIIKELLYVKDNGLSIKEIFIGSFLILLWLLKEGGNLGLSTENAFFMLIFCSRNISDRKIINFAKWISVLCLSFIVISSQIGVIPDYVAEIRNRHFLGFLYALYPSALMLNVTYLNLIADSNKSGIYRIIRYVLLLFCNTWLYLMTSSRLSFAISVIICLLGVLKTAKESFFLKKSIIAYLCVFSFAIVLTVSIVAGSNYDVGNSFHQKMNSVFSKRWQYTKKSLDKYGVVLFRRDISWNGQGLDSNGEQITNEEDYDYVDNAYIRDLQKYGAVFSLIVIICLTYSMNRLRLKEKYDLLIVLSVMSVQLMVDDLALLIQFNVLWLVLGCEMAHFELQSNDLLKYQISEKG